MNQVSLPHEDPLIGIGNISADLAHPQPIGNGRHAADLHLTRRQLEEEQHHKSLQTFSRPHFHGEEIRRHNQFPMPLPETPSRSSSGSVPAPARCRVVPECQQSCCGQSCDPDSTMPPAELFTKNPVFLPKV